MSQFPATDGNEVKLSSHRVDSTLACLFDTFARFISLSGMITKSSARARATHVVVDCCRCNYPLLIPYVNVSITSVASVRYERAANVWISASAAARGCATRRTSLNCQFARRCEDMSHFGMACQFGKKHARALTNWSIKLVGRRWRHTRPISLTLMINFHRES